jgi:alcohol dehydrogenase
MYLPEQFSFFSPAKTCCGKKALEMMPNEMAAMGATRAMVMCSRTAAERGWCGMLQKGFQGGGIPLGFCHDIPERVDTVTLRTLTDLYRDQDCDAIIALGGGGIADTAKAVNLLVSERSDDLFLFTKENAIARPLQPLAIVMSAEGDGYETSGYARLGSQRLFSPHLAPHLAVIDDRLTAIENPAALLSMVLSALGGAVDACLGERKNPFTDAYAEGCIRLIFETLPDGRLPGRKDRNARNGLVGAVNLGAAALSNNGRGPHHRAGEVLSAGTGVPAGVLAGLLMPHILRREAKKGNRHIGDLLPAVAGFDAHADTPETERERRVLARVSAWIENLFAENARYLPTSLNEAGLDADTIGPIGAAAAMAGKAQNDIEETMAMVALAFDGAASSGA